MTDLPKRPISNESVAGYDYEFYVWPHERHWEPAVYELFRHYPRVSVPADDRWFSEFRDSLDRSGFTLREIECVPHYEPE